MNRPLSITLAAGALAASSALAAFAVPASAGPSSTEAPTFAEPYRPQFHFAPEKNWMNDPNGLVYHQGGVPPLLPTQSQRQLLGGHVLGARRQ
jgi:fructan beta-fructosidase